MTRIEFKEHDFSLGEKVYDKLLNRLAMVQSIDSQSCSVTVFDGRVISTVACERLNLMKECEYENV